MTHRHFQNALRAEIARSGHTQAQFAKKLRIAQSTLESWLTAKKDAKWARTPNRFEQIGILSEAAKVQPVSQAIAQSGH